MYWKVKDYMTITFYNCWVISLHTSADRYTATIHNICATKKDDALIFKIQVCLIININFIR